MTNANLPNVHIDLFADVVCPWCLIGAKRLEQAQKMLDGEINLTVTYHPFILDPSTPDEGVNLAERLRAKYGANPKTMFSNVEKAAKDAGFTLSFGEHPMTYPTVRAHTLLRHAQEKGTQSSLMMALYEAFFIEHKNIGDKQLLNQIAQQHGFTSDEIASLLDDPSEIKATFDEAKQASTSGIQGVPFFIFGGRLAVSGGQPPEVLAGAIREAHKRGFSSTN